MWNITVHFGETCILLIIDLMQSFEQQRFQSAQQIKLRYTANMIIYF